MSAPSDALARPSAAPSKLSQILLDPKKPAEVRAKTLLDVLQNTGGNPMAQHAVLTQLLQQAGAQTAEAQVLQMMEAYEQALAELEHGPVRPATFIAGDDGVLPGPRPRAHVITPDGQERYAMLHTRVAPGNLKPGATVYLDPKGSVVLGVSTAPPRVGQQGTFLRRLDGSDLIEATVQNERLLLYASEPILDAVKAGKLKHGDRLLVCSRRLFALATVPAETEHQHRFLDRSRVPDVIAERDIGKPHWILDHLVRRTRILLFRPDLLQRFDLRPRFSALLTGPSGCGKTLTIRAFLREFDQMLVERTGRNDLGSRVVRVKFAELLSEWLGRSDKNIEELFGDVQAVASKEVETARGERLRLPVVVILEEVEGIARRRGEHEAGVYDRILATLLQRLDDPTDDLGKLPLLLISTSNRPDLIDAAMCRRLGVQARFTRLDRDGLAAVLDKKLRPEYPYAGPGRAAVLNQVVEALFGSNAERQSVVEVTLRGGRKLTKARRDFLTGGIVEQAVSSAIDEAVFAAEQTDNGGACGLTAAALIDGLRRHIDALADTLTAYNAADHVDLPEGVQAASVRRLRGGPLPSSLAELDE
ncbi:MAG TPA: ATP-binding protein [Gemmataceae bacterium]|nr:ATP-binding protein [Gemmataceae bacterium]